MIVWMLYSALVALIVVAAARAAEWLARLAGYRVRWIWTGALALTLFLSASAAMRETRPAALPTPATAMDLRDARVHVSMSWRETLGISVESLRRSVDASLGGAVATVHRVIPPAADVYAVSLSSAISLGLVLVLVGVGRRFRRARRDWPVVSMHGVDVRLAPHIGPVVIGIVRPEIVVPRWLLTLHDDDQRLVVTHEREHVRAGDPLLLGFAWAAVVAAPWNPAVWYMLSRLRLAVELDCDARVLRRGAAPRSYGSLLIDVAQHASALRLNALALADDSSHLHQRILAMKPTVPRFARLRGGLAAAVAFTGVLVACQATLPTDAEIERMDVGTATRTAHELARAKHVDTAVAYTVDGVSATSSEATALPSNALGRVEIVTGMQGKPTQINIQTHKLALKAPVIDTNRMERVALMQDGSAGRVVSTPALVPLSSPSKSDFTGLIFIDGVRATSAQMMALDKSEIESVDVYKGQYAVKQYSDPRAVNGVIIIKTKHGGAK